MPDYKCATCLNVYLDEKAKPTCNVLPRCKNGLYVNAYTPPTATQLAPIPATYVQDVGGQVAENYNSNGGGGVHKPHGPVYIHQNGRYAISRDDSTHARGQAAWKGFMLTAKGWQYAGSYDAGLQLTRGGKHSPDALPQ